MTERRPTLLTMYLCLVLNSTNKKCEEVRIRVREYEDIGGRTRWMEEWTRKSTLKDTLIKGRYRKT
jgi:hypothetical protein